MSKHLSPVSGVTDGKFAPCPSSPNCVSSQSNEAAHFVEPLRYADTQPDARERLLAIIHSLPRTQVLTDKNNYIHVTFRSLIFRFIDDVEFYFSEGEKLVHVRSASRVGYSDLGTNRKRVEEIRKRFYR